MSTDQPPTVSLPSIALLAALGFLLYRYFFSPSPSDANTRQAGMRFTHAQVEQVAQMFPQLSRRDIMWDLQRNGGSVPATVERVMNGRSLDMAPPSFQPRIPSPPTANTLSSTTAGSVPRRTEPDLITRYNLQNRVESSTSKGKGKEREEDATEEVVGAGWAATKDARQQILKRRRDEMILAARRKMQEKDEMSGTFDSAAVESTSAISKQS